MVESAIGGDADAQTYRAFAPCTQGGDGRPLRVFVLTNTDVPIGASLVVRPIAVAEFRSDGPRMEALVVSPLSGTQVQLSTQIKARIAEDVRLLLTQARRDAGTVAWGDTQRAYAIARDALAFTPLP